MEGKGGGEGESQHKTQYMGYKLVWSMLLWVPIFKENFCSCPKWEFPADGTSLWQINEGNDKLLCMVRWLWFWVLRTIGLQYDWHLGILWQYTVEPLYNGHLWGPKRGVPNSGASGIWLTPWYTLTIAHNNEYCNQDQVPPPEAAWASYVETIIASRRWSQLSS